MADSQLTAGLGKRKRRAEDRDEGSSSKYDRSSNSLSSSGPGLSGLGSHYLHQRSSPSGEALLRLHGHTLASHEASGHRSYPKSPPVANSEWRPVKQMKRLNPKVSFVKTPSHLMDIELDVIPSSPPRHKADTHTNSDLRPCHACSTAPKRKRDLENYLDCRRCTERTCYICARQCVGCRKEICKKCIVEVGQEGDPWCLECYSRHINT